MRPGDDLRLHVTVLGSRDAPHTEHAEARVERTLVCEGGRAAVLARP